MSGFGLKWIVYIGKMIAIGVAGPIAWIIYFIGDDER